MTYMRKQKKIRYPYEFDSRKRKLAQHYTRGRLLNFVFNGIVIPIGFLFIFLSTGSSALLSSALSGYGFLQVPAYAFLLLWFLTAVEFPLRFYFSYIREHSYGLSNYTLGGWFKDFLKGVVLNFVTAIPIVAGLFYLLQFDLWWIYAGIALTLLRILFTYIIPVVVLPFFYKMEPYKDEEHRKKILEIARNAGLNNIENVYVANESAKSTKANALFSGFGSTKRIVLFDTLTGAFTKDEIETVIGHELGHYTHRDEFRDVVLQTILVFPMLFVIDIVLRTYIGTFGISSPADVAILPLILLSYSVLGLIAMPIENTYSRKMEREADLFALDSIRKPDAQISTEKRFADMALSEIKSHPITGFALRSHPDTVDRIKSCEDWKRRNKRK